VKPTAGFTFNKVISPSLKMKGRPDGRPFVILQLFSN
jgi:hypothetical protein